MNKKLITKLILLSLVCICCFIPTVYADGVEMVHEKVTTEDGEDKAMVEQMTGLVIGNDDSFGDWYFTTDENTGTVSITNGSDSYENAYIVITDSAGVSKEYPIYGGIIKNGEDGYMLSLGSNYDDYAEGSSFTVQIRDPDGNLHDGGSLSLTQETTEKKEDGILKTLWKLLTDTANTVAAMVEELIVELMLPIGDGVVYIVTKSVGEAVTTSKLVYNDVKRVSVDYWNIPSGATTVAGMMSRVVNPWYNFFFQIAVIVYMMCLIVVGIKVMFTSTAGEKAKFKEVLVSWVVGVALLTCFPFVMKYTVALNNAMVQSIQDYTEGADQIVVDKPGILTLDKAYKTFGTSAFVEYMLYERPAGGSTIDAASVRDSMMRVRLYAQYKAKVILVVVYFIMIGQMMVILFMYYKRAFMIAFLITIFPLVAMTYVLDKMGDKKAQSFEIWFKEYIVNVIVQLFHAVVYAVVVALGVERFLTNDGQWLFMIISLLFLFEGEKILRNIFNVKSSANTVGDLAATGLAAYGFAKQAGGLFKGKSGGGSQQDKKDLEGINERASQRLQMNAGNPDGGQDGSGGGTPPPPPGSGSDGSYQGDDPDGVGEEVRGDTSAARDTVLQNVISKRLKKSKVATAISGTSKVFGAAIGATYGMSKGDTNGGLLANTVGSAIVGKTIGETVTAPVAKVADAVSKRATGKKTAKQIADGKMDGQLGLNGEGLPPNINPDEIIGKHGETVQEIYRQALAEMARVTATKGKAKGEEAYWNFIDENTMNRS